jgi:hypothetical protein
MGKKRSGVTISAVYEAQPTEFCQRVSSDQWYDCNAKVRRRVAEQLQYAAAADVPSIAAGFAARKKKGGQQQQQQHVVHLSRGQRQLICVPSDLSQRMLPPTTFTVNKVAKDGACLFHSLALLLQRPTCSIRATLVSFIRDRADDLCIQGCLLRQWIEWEADLDAESYATHMALPTSWGGGIELAITPFCFFSRGARTRLSAFVQHNDGYACIASFENGASGLFCTTYTCFIQTEITMTP